MQKNTILKKFENNIRDKFFISDCFYLCDIKANEITFKYKYNKNIRLTIYNTMSNTKYVLSYSFDEKNNTIDRVLKDLLSIYFYSDKTKFIKAYSTIRFYDNNGAILNKEQKDMLIFGLIFDSDQKISVKDFYIQYAILDILKNYFEEYDLKTLKYLSMLIFERNLYVSDISIVNLKNEVFSMLNKKNLKESKDLMEINFKL